MPPVFRILMEGFERGLRPPFHREVYEVLLGLDDGTQVLGGKKGEVPVEASDGEGKREVVGARGPERGVIQERRVETDFPEPPL